MYSFTSVFYLRWQQAIQKKHDFWQVWSFGQRLDSEAQNNILCKPGEVAREATWIFSLSPPGSHSKLWWLCLHSSSSSPYHVPKTTTSHGIIWPCHHWADMSMDNSVMWEHHSAFTVVTRKPWWQRGGPSPSLQRPAEFLCPSFPYLDMWISLRPLVLTRHESLWMQAYTISLRTGKALHFFLIPKLQISNN